MANQPNRKIVKEYNVSDYEVMTDNGWKDIEKTYKTVPYNVWMLKLENGYFLECANDHIVYSNNNEEIFVKNVKIGQYIDTDKGLSKCVKVHKTDTKEENMYDLQVNGGTYYTNGIKSHNSTTVSIYLLWYAIFNNGKNVGIVSNKEKSAKSILLKIKRMYENLPSYMKPGVVAYNKLSIEFDNETIIHVSATSPDAFRGETMNLVLADELAFVRPNMANDFWSANFPTLSASKESKIVVISTPNGLYNLFHLLYTGAERGTNTFKTSFANWKRHPDRDDKWAQEQIDNIGIIQFNQEYGCKFLGSVNTVIDINTLETLVNMTEKPIHTELDNKFLIYEKPVDGAEYVLGVDTAKGTGEHYSAIQVLKIVSISPIKMEQVATYFNNMIDVYKFSDVVNRIAKYYNNAWMMVENNSEGAAVVNRIWWEYENEKLVNTSSKSTGLGIRASTKTKPRAVLLMKKLIEDGSLLLKDVETMDELSSFIERNNKFFGDNKTDDLISALYWGTYIVEMNVLSADFKFRKETKEEETAWGIIPDTDGNENQDWSWLNMELRG